jgi:opacity protein-like surface antigen
VLATWALAAQADPLGFYIGAGVGEASVKLDEVPAIGALGIDETNTGWKALIGMRPISLLGAELEYFESGTATATAGIWNVDAQVRGAGAYGLVYLPLPLPLIDIYGKLGAVRLQTTANGSLNQGVPCGGVVPCVFGLDHTATNFAWGLGVQVKVSMFAIRAEYEVIDSPYGDPELLSLALLLHF